MKDQSGIPPSSAQFFQEYHFNDLDPDMHADLVMERLLAFGSRPEIRWVFDRYGKQAVIAWLQEKGSYKLPRPRYKMFCVILGLTPILHPRVQKRIWPY